MKLSKAQARDKKNSKRKNGMRTTGRSVFTIQTALIKRSKRNKKQY